MSEKAAMARVSSVRPGGERLPADQIGAARAATVKSAVAPKVEVAAKAAKPAARPGGSEGLAEPARRRTRWFEGRFTTVGKANATS